MAYMDRSKVPYVRGRANFYHGTPQAPPADWCKQLWQQLEFAMSERERGLHAWESQLTEQTALLEERTRAMDVAQQEKWAQLEEKRKALDIREQSLVIRERRYDSWRQNGSGPRPKTGVDRDSEQERMRVLATAAVCASGPGGEADEGTLVFHGNKDMMDVVDHPACSRETHALVKTEPVDIVDEGEVCINLMAVSCGDKEEETGAIEPQKCNNVGTGHPPAERQLADEVVAGEQDEKPKKLDDVEPGDRLDDVPLSIRKKLLKGNKRRKQPDQNTPEMVEADLTSQDQILPAAPKVAKVRPKGKEKHPSFGKQNVPVEVALQEDAPGLLESLRERGLVEDLRLFGDGWEDELDPAIEQDEGFADLEKVVSKVWSSSGLITVPPPNSSGHSGLRNKPYCLGCLATLVEQARSMNRQKWPVEWGWCRPLQAFVFVFVKHNRIVLERPEYGFATYFFELVQTISYPWQVRRLVTVMCAASVGRAALMENKPLEVGKNLSQEEAEILEEYGWSPNSGIATLLNFCDRVVHDYNKGEGDSMEWKVKIGKLLMDGYDHGSMIKDPPRRLQLTSTCSTLQSIPSSHGKVAASSHCCYASANS